MSSLNRESLGKLSTYLKTRIGMWEYRRGWMKGDCPYCGKKDKFGVNLSNYRSNCFSCLAHPKPIQIVRIIEGFTTDVEAWNHVDAFEDAAYLETPSTLLLERAGSLPDHFKLLMFGDGIVAKSARTYMKRRGFNIEKLSYKGIGYCNDGDYFGRIIFPVYEQGKLRYFNARQFIETGPKFMNPPVEDFGVGKNLLMYNVDALHLYEEVFIVESITNALTLGDRAISIGGKVMSDYQKSKILRSPIKRITFILDPDANWRALKTGLQFVNYKITKVVELPEGSDVNDIGKRATKKYINKFDWENYQGLFKRYINTPKEVY